MNSRTRLPLPEGDRFADVLKFRSLGQGGGRKLYECWVDAIHAYSDAENAALRERVKVLEEALQRYVNYDLLTGTRGKMNEIARAALEISHD